MPLTGAAHAPRVFLSACEASADLHGAHLMHALRKLAPGAAFTGIGGERMVRAGLAPVFHARDLSVMGLAEVLARIGTIRKAFRRAAAVFERGEVDIAVLIDAPDFNLRLASRARRAGVPVVYFISPKVWAWRRGRVRHIARLVQHMMVILPFEIDIYRQAGVPATYVGNPLVDEMAEVAARAPQDGRWRPSDFGLDDARPTVGLLPGSRPRELAAILPTLLEAARLLAARLPGVQFLLPMAPSLNGVAIREQVGRSGVDVVCVDSRAVEVMTAADALAVASGTATLQAALADTPGVIVYRMSPVTWAIGNLLVNVAHAGLVNLVAGERVVPELLQGAFTADAVCDHLYRLLTDPDAAAAQREGLARVRKVMGAPGAPERAARIVLAEMGVAA